MTVRELRSDPDLASALGTVILDVSGSAGSSTDGQDDRPAQVDHLRLVGRSALAERITKDLLGQAVAAARSAGHSWAAIGDELGLTRQAVQQRFGAPTPDELEEPEFRWLGPVTAFDEMQELELAGRRGWRTVGTGMLRHRMQQTDTQWEHRRVVWARSPDHYETDGWQVGCRAFPWLYLVRDLGTPPRPGPGASD